MQESYTILDPEVMRKKHLTVQYMKVECTVCHTTWGIVPTPENNQTIHERNMTCKNCAVEKLLKLEKGE